MPATFIPSAKTKWTLDEYHQMADHGFFQDQRVEFIAGEIIEMPPQKDSHYIAIALTESALRSAFPTNVWVRNQGPLWLSDGSEPEPDVSVVLGGPRDYLRRGHPRTALLVIEVSDTTLAYDRREKQSIYARAGIGDYWIINLVDQAVDVFRSPDPDASLPFGFGYCERRRFTVGQEITPLATPSSPVKVEDLLP